ncbi:MAG: pilus assembly protein [Rhodospirillaceae bacterium]|nr:pilus assembly protein [Rhodospirillaceae bacterium]MBT3493049.1 pilus assembly protein [Rhodospirillaceae bacterium]MBT3782224.1 pilus assembly protein [Rhodospirillaceae bacterium]MBT3977743.1 pilus assembly protein [Rhodospirillaceae bacterium]MBT4168613.1 pilus assembly protein [Rhodospirillaceae bacterium]
MNALLRAFARCRRGIAAMEFALVAPVGVVLLMGISEFGTAMLIDRKVTRATHVGADLVAQETVMDADKVSDLFTAMEAILEPFPTDAYIRVTSVWLNPDTDATEVDWSEARNGAADSGDYELPQGLIVEDSGSVIVTHIIYSYSPLYDDFILGDITLEDKSYLKPRRTTKVAGP